MQVLAIASHINPFIFTDNHVTPNCLEAFVVFYDIVYTRISYL